MKILPRTWHHLLLGLYIKLLYRLYLKRAPDKDGLEHYIRFITNPARLLSTAIDIARSHERSQLLASKARRNSGDYYDKPKVDIRPLLNSTQAVQDDTSQTDARVDASWYSDRYPDVAQAGVDPTDHFSNAGKIEGRFPNRTAALNALFDQALYLKLNPDIRSAQIDPISHFLESGHAESRPGVPLPLLVFDSDFYISRYPDVAHSSMTPLQHFIEYGWPQGRLGSSFPLMDGASLYETRKYYEPESESLRQVKAIAFYLPQFHPIPENDEWWGAGFTEWRNVTRARPFYEKHAQPKQPEALGYYDLRLPETLRAQAELARIHGIYAFCFYYYWFSGRRLLEKPLEVFLKDAAIDIAFCVCWANENWTRTWDGLERDVLISQSDNEGDEELFIKDLIPLFNDNRYVRVAGRPLLIIYRPNLLRNPAATIASWRRYCHDNGIGDIYICMTESFERCDPQKYGLDASIEFPPLMMQNRSVAHQLKVDPSFSGDIYSYQHIVDSNSSAPEQVQWARFLGVMPSWDNTARRMERGYSFFGSTPYLFHKWLSNAVARTISNPKIPDKFVFINAWNEWAEGAYLEPDMHVGYGYLNGLRRAVYREEYFAPKSLALLDSLRGRQSQLAVVCHLFHTDLAEDIAAQLTTANIRADLFISVPVGLSKSTRDKLSQLFPSAFFLEFPNRGRDVLPFLQIASRLRSHEYTAICKIHSKRSTHRRDGDRWRSEIFGDLLGSAKIVESNVERIRLGAGIVAPRNHALPIGKYIGSNRPKLLELLARLKAERTDFYDVTFVAGTMFWYAPRALDPLISIGLGPDDFEAENGQLDGTTAHAVERLIGISCHLAGYQTVEAFSDSPRSKESESFDFAIQTR